MKITNIFPYKAPLPFEQKVAGKSIAVKEGSLIEVDKKFLLDISPFPGLSQHLGKKVVASFFHHFPSLQKKDPFKVENPHHAFALFQLACQKKNITKGPFELFPCELVDPRVFIKKTFTQGVIKTKVSPSNFRAIAEKIKKSQNTRFRLDGNAQFSLNEYILLEKELWPSRKKIDFIEEPLKNFDDYKDVNLPYAHEEHLQEYLEKGSNAEAIVIKPSQQGLQILDQLKEKRVILSSAFETPPALHALYVLAKKNAPEAHGLGASLSFEECLFD